MEIRQQQHDDSLSLLGINAPIAKEPGGDIVTGVELIRSTELQKGQQIDNVARLQ